MYVNVKDSVGLARDLFASANANMFGAFHAEDSAPWAGRQPSSTRDGATGTVAYLSPECMQSVQIQGHSCEYNNCVETYRQRLFPSLAMRHHREKHLQSCRKLMSKHSPVALEVFGFQIEPAGTNSGKFCARQMLNTVLDEADCD